MVHRAPHIPRTLVNEYQEVSRSVQAKNMSMEFENNFLLLIGHNLPLLMVRKRPTSLPCNSRHVLWSA
jgi:hypothetical protein